MSKKAGVVIGATFALPLLSPTMAEAAKAPDLNGGDPVGAPTQLTERELDTVTAGSYTKLPILPRDPGWCPIKRPPRMTTMAVGEEGGEYPWPILIPPKEPPIATTLALGEEGGPYPYPAILESELK